MEKIIRRIISCIILLALLIFVLRKETVIMERKDSNYKYEPFFEHAKDMDVLFFGNSHVVNGIFPMELWDEYGITSYNFGGHANQIATTYWVMENALDYAKPKVVVVDCNQLDSMLKTSDNFSYVHISFDAFPLSKTKIKAANDLLNDPEIDRLREEGVLYDSEKRTKLGLLWDYSVYHSRWDELSQADFTDDKTIEYGAESRVRIEDPIEGVPNEGDVIGNIDSNVGVNYLKKIIDSCREQNIEVLLVYLPHPMENKERWKSVNTAAKIAEECNVKFINFQEKNIVDFDTDCYDSNSHLNPAGAWKVTNYLGQFLKDNYDVLDHRDDDNYDYWKQDYEEYANYKSDRLNDVLDINTYLMLLQDPNYGFVIDMGDTWILDNSLAMRLLENKGVDINQLSEDTRFIIVSDKGVSVVDDDSIDADKQGVLNKDAFCIEEGAISINVFDKSDPKVLLNKRYFKNNP